jgi:hypothetical protein
MTGRYKMVLKDYSSRFFLLKRKIIAPIGTDVFKITGAYILALKKPDPNNWNISG